MCFSAQLHAENASPSESSRGVWSSLKRTWHGAVDGAESAVKSAGSAVQSASKSVTGVFAPGDAKAVPKMPFEITVACEPSPVVLKKHQKITVLVRVHNGGKRTQLLEFQTSQRADAVLRGADGQIVARAASALPLQNDPGLVTVNPGERLEYALSLPTNAMVAGRKYTLECALVGQSGLSARLSITPL